MTDRWRCFVAVPIGEDLRGALARAVDAWRGRPDLAGLRWTDPSGWHLTLAFLGSTEPEAVSRLVEALARVAARHAPLRLATGGLGAFPSRAHARVVWYGVADAERRLAALAQEIAPATGVEGDARFRAHVTLARVRAEPIDARPWLEGAAAPAGELTVDRLELMRSHLGRGPAHYETLATVPLGALSRG